MKTTKRDPMMPIAIIGIGCRFPGGVTNPDQFWQVLAAKTDTICEVPSDRWNYKKFFHPNTNKPGKSYARWGGFLQENVFEFDPLFFGISPREAEAMDPQQRYVLQTAYEALEDAGLPLQSVRGSNTGVFIGGFTLDNKLTQLNLKNIHLADASTATSSTMAILANRLSHAFDLRGPSLTVDTACSSSLVATHLAVGILRAGDCDTAIVGGVTIMNRPEYSITMCNGGFLSKHGRCMAFDERAEGYTRGEGCGIVILKPLELALRDNDRIYSVIRNTGINQDGATQGIAAPNGDSQYSLIRKVYEDAGMTPADIQVIEAHGTGTQAGDTTECTALDRFVSQTARAEKVVVGSVKTNIGHLEAAAGVAGLIKASLMADRGRVLPNIHFEKPNPKIPFDEMGIRIPTEEETWPVETDVRRVSVNSFGYGGTNAHAVLENSPKAPQDLPEFEVSALPDEDSLWILPVTAQDNTALSALASKNSRRLVSAVNRRDLNNLLHSACHRQSFHRNRICVVGSTANELAEELQKYVSGEFPEATVQGSSDSNAHPLVFVFTGMGPQWYDMGNELYRTEPVYREFVDRADRIFQEISGWSICSEMQKCEATSRMSETSVAQPANFILQAGLLHLLEHNGIRPDIVVGHSVGEVASAYASGSLSLADALTVSFHRSRLQATLAGSGRMLAAGLSVESMKDILREFDQVEIAAINSPQSVTIAGNEAQLQAIADRLTKTDVFNRLLAVEVPYHSVEMEPIREALCRELDSLCPSQSNLEIYSTVTGTRIEIGDADNTTKECISKIQASKPDSLKQVRSIGEYLELSPESKTPTDILVLAAFDTHVPIDGEGAIENFATMSRFARSVITAAGNRQLRLHFVTENAFKINRQDINSNVGSAALNALGVLIENEHPNIQCHFTDVSNRTEFVDHLEAILFAKQMIRERAIRQGTWFRQSIDSTYLPPSKSSAKKINVHERCVALRQDEPGNVDSLALREINLEQPGDHEVQIKIHASSLNFKDLLKVYGQISESSLENTYSGDSLGVDVSGTITRVGSSVKRFQVGDRWDCRRFVPKLRQHSGGLCHCQTRATGHERSVIVTELLDFVVWLGEPRRLSGR